MTQTQQDEARDAELSVTDAELILAGIREIAEYAHQGGLPAAELIDIARDVFPRLKALEAYVLEQVAR